MGVIYGHRGAPAEFPENTLPGFRRALELGVRGIELDVHLSADGVPVVIHDETVDRTTNGTGPVANLTVAELRQLDAGQGAYVPTLAEVLDLVHGGTIVDIEVKANEAGEAALREAQSRDIRWLISSFDWDVLRYVRSVNATCPLWVLTPGATEDALAAAAEIGSTTLAIWERAVDEDIAIFLRERGINFWPWTVNDVERARELLEWGAVGICTDNPALMQETLGDWVPVTFWEPGH